ncbi:peptidoglycan DD-metalloendopeptidase family protein [Thalassobius sp. I31.1]|uniref:peptidoglycan DD-metalloendopeptidase family protein n=1 Tax=Thalassobius sp. I31.1 TaxID=2109912 RepID=UPI000D1B141F|nr:peptidoglycan DD-metalloendopeptidase family protein [Thalassobius sp. I31.1]
MTRPFIHNVTRKTRLLSAAAIVALTAGCFDNADLDLRNNFGNGIDTSGAVRQASSPRPRPDNRGVISYPNYQVAVARRGDDVTSLANRLGVDPHTLANYNGVATDTSLRNGEIVALPGRVSEPSEATGAVTSGRTQTPRVIDVETLASGAIDRAPNVNSGTAEGTINAQSESPTGNEPVRHKVGRGETAYSVARLYNVSVRSLAQWNGLGSDLNVREGQYLLIPTATQARQAQNTTPEPAPAAAVSAPGTGSTTPVPPSASSPLPQNDTTPAEEVEETPEAPDLGETRSDSGGRLVMPVDGNIIRPFDEGRGGGIDISADAGKTVVAADAGTVAAITEDTDDVPVLVLRHSGNLLTIYANVSNISVSKGDRVTRGQQIATVRDGNPSFIRFEVRRGFDPVDPVDFLN